MRTPDELMDDLDLARHDGLLMFASIERASRELFLELEADIARNDVTSRYKSSAENDGCLTFVYSGKLCTAHFYEPDLIEFDFDFRDFKNGQDLLEVIALMKEISAKSNLTVTMGAEGDEAPFAIISGGEVEFKSNGTRPPSVT